MRNRIDVIFQSSFGKCVVDFRQVTEADRSVEVPTGHVARWRIDSVVREYEHVATGRVLTHDAQYENAKPRGAAMARIVRWWDFVRSRSRWWAIPVAAADPKRSIELARPQRPVSNVKRISDDAEIAAAPRFRHLYAPSALELKLVLECCAVRWQRLGSNWDLVCWT